MNDKEIKPVLMNYRQTLKYMNIGSYQLLYKLIEDGLKVTTLGSRKYISVANANKYIKDHTK